VHVLWAEQCLYITNTLEIIQSVTFVCVYLSVEAGKLEKVVEEFC